MDTSPYDRLLHRRGITHRRFAQAVGIDETVVSRSFRRQQGFDPHWRQIAKALDVSLDWLLSGVGRPWQRPDITFGEYLGNLLDEHRIDRHDCADFLGVPADDVEPYLGNRLPVPIDLAQQWADRFELADRERSYFIFLSPSKELHTMPKSDPASRRNGCQRSRMRPPGPARWCRISSAITTRSHPAA